MFDIVVTGPFSLTATCSLGPAQVQALAHAVLQPGHEVEKDLFIKFFFTPEVFETDVERGEALVVILKLLEDEETATATSLDPTSVVRDQ